MANSKRLTMTSKVQRSEPITIGLDIGYGVTKAVTDQNVVTFPSVAGYAHHIRFRADQLSQLYPGEQITDEDGDWFVGNLALSQLKAHEQLRLRGRTVDESALGNIFRKRLARVAIGNCCPTSRKWSTSA